MLVNNRYQINLTTISSASTATTINIPINMEYQLVDQSELINRDFVDVEVEKAINPILDYEKVRFLPLDTNNVHIDQITYNLNLLLSGGTTLGATDYESIGFNDDDIKFERENFKQTFLNLSFYDTDNPLVQRLISNITIFSEINPSDLLPINTTTGIPGQPKPAKQIHLTFVLTNPILNPRGFSEGYHLYDYKDELKIGEYKYLYMRASFKNAKTGKNTNLMVDSIPYSIDNLVHTLYTRYKLIRTNTGFYYEIDDTYHGNGVVGPNNVSYASNNVTVNLYQIQAL
jgi:hypothetical protein